MKQTALIAAIFLASATYATPCELEAALSKWKSGDIEEAIACAERVEPSSSAEADRRSFLLLAIASVKGRFPKILPTSRGPPSSPRRPPTICTILPYHDN